MQGNYETLISWDVFDEDGLTLKLIGWSNRKFTISSMLKIHGKMMFNRFL